MNPELIRIVDGIARDKNIEREQIYTDIEQAIASGLRKQFNTEDTSEFQVNLDRTTGLITANRSGEPLVVGQYRLDLHLFPGAGLGVLAHADQQLRTIVAMLHLDATALAINA